MTESRVPVCAGGKGHAVFGMEAGENVVRIPRISGTAKQALIEFGVNDLVPSFNGCELET